MLSTATVKTSSMRALQARQIVETASTRAAGSADVVRNAKVAMDRIRASSSRIHDIIDAIDAIAFQTNLLALNAGVEAVRAGDAGKGFAVVAQEVRELAQRSAIAAREIADLVTQSVREVDSGSSHVDEAGTVLMDVSSHIIEVASHVAVIADANREQSASLQSVNESINEIDSTTQRNATVMEETNVSAQTLADRAEHLTAILGRFDLRSQKVAKVRYLTPL